MNVKIDAETIKSQHEQVFNSRNNLLLTRAATIGDGILKLTEKDCNKYLAEFEKRNRELRLLKFVPSSGAASRMFADLWAFQSNPKDRDLKNQADRFITQSPEFPFDIPASGDLNERVKSFLESENSIVNLPKALIPFHKYENEVRTALDEHVQEAFLYTAQDSKAALHLSIDPKQEENFIVAVERIITKAKLEHALELNIGYSFQDDSSRAVAFFENGEVAEDEQGNTISCPGGHGALIKNLESLDADIIFIKNIDNVQPDHLKTEMLLCKKILAGLLLEIQKKVFSFLNQLENTLGGNEIESISQWIEKTFGIKLKTPDELKNSLSRPLRVCGMVKNEGKAGGGPFFTEGDHSLQIVELSEITSNEKRNDLLKNTTHFNPVDIVCSIKNKEGSTFNLNNFIDHDRFFIVKKKHQEKQILYRELPGLWNGGMAFWNTVFVEVPISTFSPVKTLFDLLSPAHQPLTGTPN